MICSGVYVRKREMLTRTTIALATIMLALCGPARIDASAQTKNGQVTLPAFSDISGARYNSAVLSTHPATVFVFVSSQCPVSNVYSPRLSALADHYRSSGVAVLGVYSDRQETIADIERSAKAHGLSFPIVKDAGNVLADRLHARVTPQAIVVDAHGAIQYSGRIDDNPVATRVVSNDLANAIDAVLAGKPVAPNQVVGIGCSIRRVMAAKPLAGVPTYARDIAPILRSKCEGCHHDGEVAPFSLCTYAQASAWAADIKRYTQNKQMPPWKPEIGYGQFKDAHNRVLDQHELDVIAHWADSGAPQGNPALAPAPNRFAKGWRLGEPDIILQADKEFHLSADGEDVYRNFVIKSNFDEDRYIAGVEVHPGNPAVVHHVIAYIDGKPMNGGKYASEALEGRDHDGQPGFTSFGGPGFNPTGMLAGWAPGNDPYLLPDGVANRVPKGSRVVIQVHYHKDGKPETDLTRIGVHFCKTTIDKVITGGISINFGFKIPPGAERYEAHGMWLTGNGNDIDFTTAELTSDQHIVAVTPHMHLLGKEMKVWAVLPNGTEKPLVWIKDWDFNWQMTYMLKEPIAAPKGTRIKMVAYFDNSERNLRNPNRLHPMTVGWGESTFDEMCIAFVSTTKDAEHLAITPGSGSKNPVATAR